MSPGCYVAVINHGVVGWSVAYYYAISWSYLLFYRQQGIQMFRDDQSAFYSLLLADGNCPHPHQNLNKHIRTSLVLSVITPEY